MFAARARENTPAQTRAPARAPNSEHTSKGAVIGATEPTWDLAAISIRPESRAPHPGWNVGRTDTPQEHEAERVAGEFGGRKDKLASPERQNRDGAAAPAGVREVLASPGRALSQETLARMEPRFGSDFRGVRVHADAAAARSAREIGARAYTMGNDVVFAEGEFAPGTGAGEALLAHELTHVVQQGGHAGLIQRAPAPVNYPDRPQTAGEPAQSEQGMTNDDWLSLLNSVRESSPGEFLKFLEANEGTFYPLLQRYGFKGSWTTDEAYLKDFDAAIQKWGGASRGRFRLSARDRAQVQERQRPRTREDRQYETAKVLISEYNHHGHTRGDVNRDLDSSGLMDELEKNYGFEKAGAHVFRPTSEVYEQSAIDALYKFVLHYEAEHNMTKGTSAGLPSEAVVEQEKQAEFVKAWLEGLQYVTSSVVAAMSAGAASKFTDDPKKITAAAGAGAAFEGAVGAVAPALGGRGSYKPEVVGLKDRPAAAGDWRYTGKQPVKAAADPAKTAAPPVRDPIRPPVESVEGGGQATPRREGHLSVVDPDNTLRPVPPKKPTPQLPSGPGQPPAGAAAKVANENVAQQTPIRRQKVAVGGGGEPSTGTPAKMAIKPRKPGTEFERGRRAPSAKEVLGGPRTISEHVEELGEGAQSGEKAKKKGVSTEQKQIRGAGTAMERGSVQAWGRTFPTSVSVYTNEELPPEIRSIYPKTTGAAQGGPDGIAIDPDNREIVVFDATTKPTPEHTDKTHGDAELLKQHLPERFKGYKVYSQEGWTDGGLRFSERKRH